MTEPSDDALEERLRTILSAEADSVDPSPEALTQIRARTENNRFAAWFGAPWLRPALAVGAAALIAGSVLLGTPQLRDQVLPQSLTTAPSEDGSADGNGGGHASDGVEPQKPSPEDSQASKDDAATAAPEEEGSGDGAETAASCASSSAPEDPRQAAASSAEDEESAESADDSPACSPTGDSTDPDGTSTDPGDGTDEDGIEPGDGNGSGDSGSGDGGTGSPPSPGSDSGQDDTATGDAPSQTD